MTTWNEFTASPDFQQADDDTRERLRQQYFNEYIQPSLNDDELVEGWSTFNEYTKERGNPDQGYFGDLADAFQQGAYQGSADLVKGMDKLVGGDGENAVGDWLGERADSQFDEMSPDGRIAMEGFGFEEIPNAAGNTGIRRKIKDTSTWDGFGLSFASGAGSFLPSLIPAGAAARGMSWFGKSLLNKAATGKAATKLDDLAQVAGSEKTLRTLDKANRVIDAGSQIVAYAATGAAMIGAGGAEQAQQAVLGSGYDELKDSERFMDYYRQEYAAQEDGSTRPAFERARQRLANDVGDGAFWNAAQVGAVSMGIAGPLLDKVFRGAGGTTRLSNIGRGGAIEGAQEFSEGFGQTVAANMAQQDADMNISTFGDEVSQGWTGMVVGGPVGGGLGGLAKPHTPPDQAKVVKELDDLVSQREYLNGQLQEKDADPEAINEMLRQNWANTIQLERLRTGKPITTGQTEFAEQPDYSQYEQPMEARNADQPAPEFTESQDYSGYESPTNIRRQTDSRAPVTPADDVEYGQQYQTPAFQRNGLRQRPTTPEQEAAPPTTLKDRARSVYGIDTKPLVKGTFRKEKGNVAATPAMTPNRANQPIPDNKTGAWGRSITPKATDAIYPGSTQETSTPTTGESRKAFGRTLRTSKPSANLSSRASTKPIAGNKAKGERDVSAYTGDPQNDLITYTGRAKGLKDVLHAHNWDASKASAAQKEARKKLRAIVEQRRKLEKQARLSAVRGGKKSKGQTKPYTPVNIIDRINDIREMLEQNRINDFNAAAAEIEQQNKQELARLNGQDYDLSNDTPDSRLSDQTYRNYLEGVAEQAERDGMDERRGTLKLQDDDSLVTAIGKLGGIQTGNLEDSVAESLDAHIKSKKGMGLKGKYINRNGKTVDDMATALSEVGFKVDGRTMTANELSDAINNEITGRPVFAETRQDYDDAYYERYRIKANTNNKTIPAIRAALNGETLSKTYRNELARVLNDIEGDPSFEQPSRFEPDATHRAAQDQDIDNEGYEPGTNDTRFSLKDRTGDPLLYRDGDPLPQTGQPFRFRFSHFDIPAPKMGGQFGQDVEPAGYYVTVNPMVDDAKDTTYGTASLINPLVMEPNTKGDYDWKQRLSQRYDGKTGMALSRALRGDGYDGVITLAGKDVSEVVILENDAFEAVDHGRKPSIRYRLSDESRDLVALHNLSADNLLFANELGGLPAPSMAISHKENPISGFGEITLVGDSDLVHPADNPVFDADVYSPRQPRALHRVDEKAYERALKPFQDSFDDAGDYFGMGDERLTTLEQGWPDFIRHADYDTPLLLAYTREQGGNPRIPKEKPRESMRQYINDDGFFKWLKKHGASEENRDELTRQVKAGIGRMMDAKRKAGRPEAAVARMEKERLETLFDDNGKLMLQFFSMLQSDSAELKKPVKDRRVDRDALSVNLRRKLRGRVFRKGYHNWLEQHFKPLQGELITKTLSFDYNGNRRVTRKPYTLEAIARQMMRHGVRSKEGFNYGWGSTRAKGAKQFRSLDGIRAEKDRLVSKEDMRSYKQELDDEASVLLDKLTPYHPGNNAFGVLDEISQAIGDAYRKGTHRALSEIGMDGVPNDIMADLREFMDKLAKMPTEYFEAKIKRPVRLSEFRGAVVPRGVSKDVISALKRHGITRIRYYNKRNEQDRIRALSGFSDVMFRMGDKAKPDTTKKHTAPSLQLKLAPLEKRLGVPVSVLQSETQLPRKLYRDVVRHGAQGRVRGVFDPDSGHAFVVADNVASVDDATRTVLHELVGHKGVRQVVGEKLDATLDGIYRDMSDGLKKKLAERYRDQLANMDSDTDQHRLIAEEYIAHRAERDPDAPVVQRLLSAIKRWLRQYFPKLSWTDADVVELLHASRKALRRQARVKERKVKGTGQRRRDGDTAEPFYSAVERAAAMVKHDKAPGPTWLNAIRKMPNVTTDEIQWMGLDVYLNQPVKRTRDDVLSFIRENDIDIKEVSDSQTEMARQQLEDKLEERKEQFIAELMDAYDSDYYRYYNEEFNYTNDEMYLSDIEYYEEQLKQDFENGELDEHAIELITDEDGNLDKEKLEEEAREQAIYSAQDRDADELFDLLSDETRRDIAETIYDEQEIEEQHRNELEDENEDGTRYSDYSTPGGTDYTELRLTLPNNSVVTGMRELPEKPTAYSFTRNEIEQLRKGEVPEGVTIRKLNGSNAWAAYRQWDGMEYTMSDLYESREQVIDSLINLVEYPERNNQDNFRHSHWHENNVLAFVRFKTFHDDEGRKVLLLDEVQSDWHQSGRDSGYMLYGAKADEAAFKHKETMKPFNDRRDYFINKRKESEEKFEEAQREMRQAEHEYRTLLQSDDATKEERKQARVKFQKLELEAEYWESEYRVASKKEKRARERVEKAGRKNPAGNIPQAPFKESWQALVMKRMLRHAAENDFDTVAWTTGRQQTDRYKGALRIASLDVDTHLLDFFNKGRASYHLFIRNDYTSQSIPAHPDDLDATVGKKLADKIRTRTKEHIKANLAKLKKYKIQRNPDGDGFIVIHPDGEPVKGNSKYPKVYKTRQVARENVKRVVFFGAVERDTYDNLDETVSSAGMVQQYDNNLPNWAKKYTKKWGGKVGKIELNTDDGKQAFWALPVTEKMKESVMREGQPRFMLKAYHGSPHDFDRFSTDHMGKGEGGQAYGWGLYFAGKKAVADYYREALQPSSLKVNGKSIPNMSGGHTDSDPIWTMLEEQYQIPEMMAHRLALKISRLKDYDAVLAELKKDRDDYGKAGGDIRQHQQLVDTFAGLDITIEKQKTGHGYEVELAPAQGDLLDWDKPLNQQSEKVRQALDKAGIPLYDANRYHAERREDGTYAVYKTNPETGSAELVADNVKPKDGDNAYYSATASVAEPWASGEDIYDYVKQMFYYDDFDEYWKKIGKRPNEVSIPQAASLYLKAHGIPGIAYLDGASRKKGKGDYNYVIFDGDQVDIKARYALSDNLPDDVEAVIDSIHGGLHRQSWKDRVKGWLNLNPEVSTKNGWIQGTLDGLHAVNAMERKANDGKLLEGAESAYKAALRTKNLDGIMTAVLGRGTPQLKDGSVVIRDKSKGFLEIHEPVASRNEMDVYEVWAGSVRAQRIMEEDRKANAKGEAMVAEAQQLRKQLLQIDPSNYSETVTEGGKQHTRSGATYWQKAMKEADKNLKEGKRLASQKRENLYDDAKIKKIQLYVNSLPGMKARFEKVFADYQKFNRDVLDFAQDAGLIDPEIRKLFDTGDYIPFHRINPVETDLQQGLFPKRGLSNQKSGIHKLTGGVGKISPLEAMYRNTQALIDASMKNIAMQRIVNIGADMDVGNGQTLLEKSTAAIRLSNEEVIAKLKELDVDTNSLTSEQMNRWKALLTKYTELGEGMVKVSHNGQTDAYMVNDPLLFSAITDMGPNTYHWLLKALSIPKRLLTQMVTADPSFMIRNLFRDTLSTYMTVHPEINGKALKVNPFVAAIRTFNKQIKNDESRWALMMAGGGSGGYYDINPDNIREQMSASDKQRILNSPKALWHFWQTQGSRFENANRLHVFERVLKQGGSIAEAAHQAQDVLNFSRQGQWAAMRILTQTLPFFNARVQGLNRLWRGAREDGKPGLLGIAPTMLFRGSLYAMASMALVMMFEDDERYKELPEHEKLNWHHYWDDDGNHWRIPKPFEVGAIFGSIPEMSQQYFTDREDGKWLRSMAYQMITQTLAFDPVPQTFRPMLDVGINEASFTGSPIIPMGLKFVKPEQQFDPWTSETMKQLAQAMPDSAPDWARSPKKIEYMLKGYFGTLGRYALMGTDYLARGMTDAPERPEARIRDYPVAGSFFRDGEGATRYKDELYEMRNAISETVATINQMKEKGDTEGARNLERAEKSRLKTRKGINRYQKKMTALRKEVRRIMNNRVMNAATKRQRIDRLNQQINDLARRAVKEYGHEFR